MNTLVGGTVPHIKSQIYILGAMATRIVALALLTGAVAFAQLDTNSITVTSSRTLSVQPDQIIFAVTAGTGTSTTLADVLTALQPVGITAANFSSVNSYSGLVLTDPRGIGQGPEVQWSFVLPVAFASMKTTVAALSALQQSITQNNSGLTLSFSVQGTQVSSQLQQMQVFPIRISSPTRWRKRRNSPWPRASPPETSWRYPVPRRIL